MGLTDVGLATLLGKESVRRVAYKFYFSKYAQGVFSVLAADAGTKLRQQAEKCQNITDYIDLTFNFLFAGVYRIAPLQVKEELTELLNILIDVKPKYVLEIGTSKGGTLFLLARVSSSDAQIISVDLPQGQFGCGYPEWKIPLYQSFATQNQKLSLIRNDSHAQSTLDSVKKILRGAKLDFLLIDGDHTYSGVKKDYEMYHSLVRKGGLIALHDICVHPPESGCKVDQFWNEIKTKRNCRELIKDIHQGTCGIGLIQK